MTDYLPDTLGVDVGSEAQDTLRYALDLLERHMGSITDTDEAFRCRDAIRTLEQLTQTLEQLRADAAE